MHTTIRSWTLLAITAATLGGCATTADVGTGDDETTTTADAVNVIEAYPGVTVRPQTHVVEIAARSCLDGGWLEQVACGPNTREHESLVVIDTTPSLIHASMLLAGFEAGTPGRWTYENEDYAFVAPQGSPVRVSVRWTRPDGTEVTEPVTDWIRAEDGVTPFPAEPWIFGGSEWRRDNEGREHYAADLGGSIIGLVTFGDEVIGFSKVLADQVEVQAAEWMVDESRVPVPGTEVTVVIEPWR